MNAFGKCAGGGRRAAPREIAPLLAVYTTVTQSHSALVVDVSSTGARLRSPTHPEEGADLLLSLADVRVFGTVARIDDDQFAVAFEEPLQPEDLATLRRIVASGRGLTPHVQAAIDDWVLGRID